MRIANGCECGERKHADVLLRNARYLDESGRIQSGKTIVIQQGHIAAILDTDDGWTGERVLEGSSLLWLPGLVDGHTHTSQQFLRGRLLDEKPVIWKRINVPFESTLTEEDSRFSALNCALEMMKNGTTAFVDAGGKHPEIFAQVYGTAGLRGALTYITTDSPGTPETMRITPQSGVERLIRLWESLGEQGRLKAYFSITSLMACSQELIHTVFGEARRRNAPMEVHMNEYASEVYDFIGTYGERPFLYLEEQGLLSSRMMASHCIYLSQEEMAVLQRNQIRVVHCPFSNCGKGIPPTPQLLQMGISVGLGSDGSAHGGLDIFKEMRLLRGVINAHFGVQAGDPSVLPAETLLQMASRGGGMALMDDKLGAIAPGMRADLIAVDLTQAHLMPTQNLVHSLVESGAGNDVTHMIVDGVLLMKDREILTLDEERIRYETAKHIHKQGWFAGSNAWYGI